ncbi:hypothetical protein PHISCL_02846 [Aspergillus sclerotialis]|uniref:Uncharacterized protein n=1 Tax=Aspergillus sclerotialis TaxID=2070753 RepID=A0A3A2ZPF5_9EURO|nr:hypothetical protein PHISCL_02846 [Aspergillus sclerotialis]
MEQPSVDPPPTYPPSELESIMNDDEKARLLDHYNKAPFLPDSDLFLPPIQPDAPGFTVESVLNRGLQIPSKSEYVTSGFAYPPVLGQCGVSKRHWSQFTQEIIQAAKLSHRQWTTAVAKGLGVLAIGGVMVGFLSAIPALIVARKARRNREEQNLVAATSSIGTSDLSRKIQLWNETFFQPRGILIRVDLPSDGLADLDISTSRTANKIYGDNGESSNFSSTSRVGPQSLFNQRRILDDENAREDASYRARIVVIPISKSSLEKTWLSNLDSERYQGYQAPSGDKSTA